MADELTLEQRRALALAQARLRLRQKQAGGGDRNLAGYLAQRGAGGLADTLGFMGETAAASLSPLGPVGPAALTMARSMGAPAPRGQDAVRHLAEQAGLPSREELEPTNAAERYGGRIAEFVGGSLPLAPVAGASLPAQAANVGVAGAQASILEGAKDLGAPEPLAAALSMAAPLSPAAGAAATRAVLGGGTRRMAPALADADAMNADLAAAQAASKAPTAPPPQFRPSAADAGGSDVAAIAERGGSFALGSRGTVADRADANDAALMAESQRIARQADALAGRKTPTRTGADAGRAIWQGLREDADSWFNRSQAAAVKAENKAGALIASASGGNPVWVNIMSLLPRLRQAAARQTEWGNVDPYVNDLATRIAARAGQTGGVIPFEQAVRLKTHLGELTKWSGAAPGADTALYRGLYGELAQRITRGIEALGVPAATKAWKDSQKLWTGHFERVRNYLDPVEAQLATPERIINSVLAINTPSRATALRRMVGDRRWNQVRAYAIRLMGSSKPSAIDGTLAPGADDVFSPMTFATNVNAMQRSGHLETIFGGGNSWAKLKPEWERLARVAGRVQETRKRMYNSSASASTGLPVAQLGALGSGLAALPFAGPTLIMATIGGITGAALSSRLMMNQRFVRWLATDGAFPVAALSIALVRLQSLIDAETDPEDRAAMERLRDDLQQQGQSE